MSELKTCQHCGSSMTRPPQMPRSLWAKRRWCNKDCMAAARQPAERICQRCGKTFRPVFNRKRDHQFCSIKCANVGKAIKGPYRKTRQGDRVRTVHRVVKEKEIGRPLRLDEIVHHDDEDKQNNTPSNLILTTMPAHSRHHMIGNQNARRS